MTFLHLIAQQKRKLLHSKNGISSSIPSSVSEEVKQYIITSFSIILGILFNIFSHLQSVKSIFVIQIIGRIRLYSIKTRKRSKQGCTKIRFYCRKNKNSLINICNRRTNEFIFSFFHFQYITFYIIFRLKNNFITNKWGYFIFPKNTSPLH